MLALPIDKKSSGKRQTDVCFSTFYTIDARVRVNQIFCSIDAGVKVNVVVVDTSQRCLLTKKDVAKRKTDVCFSTREKKIQNLFSKRKFIRMEGRKHPVKIDHSFFSICVTLKCVFNVRPSAFATYLSQTCHIGRVQKITLCADMIPGSRSTGF